MATRQPPVTRVTLLGALCRGLRWEEFIALYGRLILYWGRRDFGLQDSDAENLRQEVLLRVWKGIAGYDSSRGRFRDWLYVCTRNAMLNLFRGRHGEWVGTDGSTLGEPVQNERDPAVGSWQRLPERGGLDEAVRSLDEEGFVHEGLQTAVLWVRSRVHPTTWKAFLLFECFEMKAKEIAPHVGLKPAAVNQAVYRVRRLLQLALAAQRAQTPERGEPGR
jgi:RNA polymerase sigma factor (sigma-70 family)